ncbi:MAG: SdrD B-like domain-containing protein [Saprospiraceae bacterium]
MLIQVVNTAALRRWVYSLVIILIFLIFTNNVFGQLADGDLSMSIIAAPNLIVDSNVESPSTYGPEAVHLGVEICNTGGDDLTEMYINIGDYVSVPASPGIYRSRTVAESTYSGTFSFTHSASASDATRYVKTLSAGECIVQYWLVEYPTLDGSGNSVTGGSKTDDDLYLEYDIWASANDNGTARTVNSTEQVTMRSQISALANKIYPNGTNKVPTEYLNSISDILGWRSTPGGSVGSAITLEGIWFDLGRVNKGFDADGDFIPDYDAFLQPIGDPTAYDANCFRLVKSYGLIIVKKNDGTEKLIPFEDQTYFKDLPQNNTGAVGLVYYEFVPTNGPCNATLTPYQEVASGSENEKFNGDYGTYIPPLVSEAINATLDDTGVSSSPVNANVEFNVILTNSSGKALGLLDYEMPVVMETDIPTGTEYVSGSASINNTLPSGISATVLYSTDDGVLWTTTEPVTASTVTNIQWWMSDEIADTEVVDVTFQTTIPIGYSDPTVTNNGSVKLGGGAAFLEDDHTLLVEGVNSIAGTVFEDDGAGSTSGNKVHNTGDGEETGINAVSVSLYLDRDEDGVGESLISSTTADASGNYSFVNLPDGLYEVVVTTDLSSKTCNGGSCTGWILDTENNKLIDLDTASTIGTAISTTDTDFGFMPALTIEKVCNDGAIVYEDNLISYDISLTNNSYNTNPDVIIGWGATDNGASDFDNFANALSEVGPDESYASKSYTASGNYNVDATGFEFGSYTCDITSVEAVFQIYLSGVLSNDEASVEITAGGVMYPYIITTTQLNAFVGIGNVGELKIDVTAAKAWTWADLQNGFSVKFLTDKVNGGDASIIYLDAIGIKINDGATSDCVSSSGYDDRALINSIPLVDTYNASELEYVSASMEPDVVASGSLTWNNSMSLIPGETGIIRVYFTPLTPTATATNTVIINDATFLDGSDVNDVAATYDVNILNTGSVIGTIWSEGSTGSTTGWDGTTGYEGGATDLFISRITMNLYGCVDGNGDMLYPIGNTSKSCSFNGGSWSNLQTQVTDGNGNYSFLGLLDGYYYVELDDTSIPGTITSTGDPDETGGLCSTCDALWKDPTANANSLGEVSGGTNFTNINFGYTVNPTIEGTVWEDSNNDGSQDTGELGIAGVTIQLAGCTPACLNVVTDFEGNYSFEDLDPAIVYTLSASTGTLPSGGTWNETFESDGSVNNSISKTLVAGEISTNTGFGFNQSGGSTISESVYTDWDGDGTQDAGETNIVGVTVNLYDDINNDGVIDIAVDALVETIITTSTGYSFTNIPAGNYIVEIDETSLPPFSDLTADPDETGATCTTCDAMGLVTTDGISVYSTLDFGYQPQGGLSITSTVWQDANGDSVLVSEDVLPNITVELWADTDGNGTFELAKTTTTNSNGNYTFSNLPDGNYEVKVSTTDTDIPTDAFGNPSVSTNGSKYDMTIADGNITSLNSEVCSNCADDLDFGFAKLGAIGNTVYSDANGNGVQDWTESGIESVTVYLCDAASGTCNAGSALQTKITDSDGNYLFTGITPGEYTIAVVSTGLGTQTADPDRDGETCASITYPGMPSCDDEMTDITMGYSTSFMGARFGYQSKGVIGDFIWLDANADGIQDEVEPGIGDVTVTLTNATLVTIDAVSYAIGAYVSAIKTDINGYYTYSDLPDGTYDIVVTTPSDRTITSDADNIENGTVEVVINSGATSVTNGCSNCELGADFGYKISGTSSIAGNICMDTDGDGNCGTGGETQLESITVFLYSSTGQYLGESVTDVSGNYAFTNLPADTYTVSVGTKVNPLSLSITTTAGTTTSAQSVYQSIVLLSATSSVDHDFGFEYDVDIDFGDLPTTYDVTKLSEGGAYHIVPTTPTLYLGSVVDAEPSPIQNATATGDATDDGISFNNPDGWGEGSNGGSYNATVAGSGWLVAWFDFNKDGDISDQGELITSQAISTGTSTINFDIPVGADLTGMTYSRVRLFQSEPDFTQFSYTGEATNGEVEDYSILFSALPVELSKFFVQEKDCSVGIYWTTEAEVDFDYFEIQWSGDGHEFSRIGWKENAGNGNGANYEFTDKTPSEINYYRLKIVDLDGSFEYSKVVFIGLDCEKVNGGINIYPNPISSNQRMLDVEFYAEKAETQLLIVDILGRTVKRISLEVESETTNEIQIDISNLPVGTYSLQQVGAKKSNLFIIQK